MGSLRREEIYDALLDEEALDEFPARMAEAFGARSCVLHWCRADGSDETVAMNDYYTPEQMADYSANFAEHDLWTLRGLQPHNLNRAINCDDLVPASEFERSVFYNDWIRAMGDDTFHCMGMVAGTSLGGGCVGLHRGRGQGTFSDQALAEFEQNVADLGRMLSVRGRMAALRQRNAALEDGLDALGDALLIVAADGRLVHANASGEALLDGRDGLFVLGGKVRAPNGSSEPLRTLIAQAADRAGGQAGAMPVPRPNGTSHAVTVSPLRTEQGARHVLLAVRFERAGSNLPGRLRQLYGLSSAEAEIAAALGQGRAPEEIAGERGVALGTIRFQIKRLAQKMGVSRQVDIARLVNALPNLRDRAD